ncbi:MAG: nitrilase-related carbon-nitrogen hydrolase [Steroidobacteraceae bacterium]
MTTPDQVNAYTALALQVRCIGIRSCNVSDSRARMLDTVVRLAQQIATARDVLGPELRLVVLPEYFLTGFPMGEDVATWSAKAALHRRGVEYDTLARIATDNSLYLAGNAYEIDDAFPQLYFQTCFVIGPDGDHCLRYRRLISMYGPTPLDVWDRYVDTYGPDSIFPVARTPIGNLAAIASEEILYPEIARCHAMRGAEVLLHSSAEFASPRTTVKEACRIARAIENMAYVVSANSASIEDTGIPSATTDAMSKIVDFRGMVLAESGHGETIVANAEVDLAALRRHRLRPGMLNFLSRVPYPAFAGEYARSEGHPLNGALDSDRIRVMQRTELRDRQRHVIDRLHEKGLL